MAPPSEAPSALPEPTAVPTEVLPPTTAPGATATFTPTTQKPPPSTPQPPAPGGGPLAAGQVPTPGQVGFVGDRAKLKVVDGPGSAPPGTTWNEGALRFGGTVTLDGVWVKGGIEYSGGGKLTIRNSIVEGNHKSWAPILGNGGHIDVRDTTVTYNDSQWPGKSWGNGAIHGDATVTVVRCDISGTPDGIQNGPGKSLIEQNHIHDLLRAGTYPNNTHNDGIQAYGGPDLVIRHNRIDISADGKAYDGTHQNGAIFLMSSEGASTGIQIVGNYLAGGGYTLRVGASTKNAVIKDNTFGPTTGGWGEILLDSGATVAEWGNNKNAANNQLNKP
ncbi:hypothetical protein ACOBQX_15060 [Actinokineospora sp. G85]|uniref:hypothetical protein n=1 Tax=Actinokineospora sp. G85 TaxID=3406626 RepID=UPI003C791F38